MKKNLLLYIVVLILIPVFVVSIIYKSLSVDIDNNEPKITSVITKQTTQKQTKESTSKKEESNIKIRINKNNEIKELNLEDYIVGVVAGEMPASFDIEALKAQAIASRTYALYKIENTNSALETTTDDQVYNTIDEMKTKWKDDYTKYYNKILNAVNSTKNLVMKKDNKVFKSFYFAMSNGYTEDSIAVFSENNIKSVSSPWDNESLNKFKVSTTYSIDKLKELLNQNNIDNIEILSRDKTNRVEKIKVNEKTYTGVEFRKLLTLRSTDFKVEKDKDNNYIITTKGYGHGVGMSQYGANGMAKENYKYDEILKYYYQDIEITKI